MLKMLKYKKLVILFSVFIISTLLITCFTVYIIHQKTVKNLKENLQRITVSENKLIDVLANQDFTEENVLAFYKKSIQTHLSLGETGEFAIGKKINDSIYFLYISNYTGELKRYFFHKKMNVATPMVEALNGKNGFLKGSDYKGDKVYAVYAFNSTFKWGIVTKINEEEVNRPFFSAFVYSLFIAFLLIFLVSLVYVFATYPFLEKLMDSELKFRLFFENSAEIIIIYNKKGKIVEVNDTACEQLQFSKKCLLQFNMKNIEKNNKSISFEEQFDKIINEGMVVYESFILCQDRSLINVEIHAKSINYKEEVVIIAVAHNITERKQAEQKIVDRERLYRLLTENIKDVVFSFDTVDYKYIYLSPSIERLRGFTSDEVLALPFEASLKKEDQLVIRQLIKKRTYEVLRSYEERSYIDQFEQICKDGSLVWTELVSTFYLNRLTGHVEIQGVIRDISERIKSRKELITNESRYRKAQRIGKIGNWEYDIGNESFWVSDEAKRLCNLPLDKSIFTLDEIKTYIKDWESINNQIIELISSESECSLGLVIQNNNLQNEIITELIAELIRDENGNPMMISGVIQDITEKKKVEQELLEYQHSLKQQNEEYIALNEELNESYDHIKLINRDLCAAKEKAEESDRLKSAFLANMSHEIRTPMNAIVGFSEMLIKPNIAESKKEKYASIIKERTYDLLRIVEDLLDVSKIEVGQLKIFETDIELSDIFNDLYEYYHQKLLKTNKKDVLTLKLIVDKSLKNKLIHIDGQRFKQVYTNLLDNAFKFTQSGIIEFGCRLNTDGNVLFFVHDTGIGIPLDKQALVFDRFRQADESLAGRQFGGTGLGLSIVKGILKLMNGTIWLESTENVGTTFFFTIPFKISMSENETVVENPFTLDGKWKNKVVLIVEDDKSNSEYLREALTETGLILYFAENGEDALNIFKTKDDINLILMDIRLPDINGLEITKHIKKEKKHIPVIAQTAYASPTDVKECIDAGCNDYISKPINYQRLIELMDKYFSNKSSKKN